MSRYSGATPGPMQRLSGLTLVEIAVGLIAFGIVVGIVFVGEALVKAAIIRGQIQQLEAFQAQITTFHMKYDCLPGDCANITGMLGAADVKGRVIRNGDGNNLIQATSDKTGTANDADCTSGGVSGELTQLFLQLDAAGLSHYDLDGSTYFIGKGIPTAAANRATGLILTCTLTGGLNGDHFPDFVSNGHAVIVGIQPGAAGGKTGDALATDMGMVEAGKEGTIRGLPLGVPIEYAHAVDSKIDDGLPNSGNFGVLTTVPGSNTACVYKTPFPAYADIAGKCNAVMAFKPGF